MLKVLYLTSNPSPYRVAFFNELCNMCDLTVLFEKEKLEHRNEKWKFDKQIKFKQIYLKRLFNSSLCLSIITYLNKKYDVIVISGYSTPTGMLAIQYLKLRKIPFILSVDGGLIKDENRILFYIKRYFIGSANFYLSTGKLTNEYLIHYGAKESRIFYYPFTSVYESQITRVNEQEKMCLKIELGIKSKKVIIGVGQFIPRKGFDILLKSFSKIKNENITLILIGGEATTEYLDIIREYNIQNVEFVSFKEKSELEKYYKIADLLVLPTREDIWGLVVNEALAFGLPVITTNQCVAGVELITNDLNGYIIPVDDILNLKLCIEKIIFDEEFCVEISKNNISRIKDYTIEKMAEKHYEIFNEILNRYIKRR